MTQEKHKAQRSISRNLGQIVDANGNVSGVPLEVRIAYPFLQEKRTKSAANEPLDKPRYDAVVLAPKLAADATQCPNYKLLSDHCMEAANKAWGSWPQGGKWPVQDGDIPHPQKLKPGQVPLTPEQIAERNKWRAGHWVIEVTNYNDPGPRVAVLQGGVFREVPARIIDGQEMYKSGDYAYVYLCAYTFHNKTFGVNFGFEGMLFTRKGERIGNAGGPRSAAQMFGSVAGMAPPVAASTMPPGAGPAPVAPQPGPAAPVTPVAAPVYAQPAPAAAPPAPPAAPTYAAAPPTAPVAPVAPPPAPPAPGMAMPGLPPIPGR